MSGTSVGVDAILIHELNEQYLVRDCNGEEPEEPVELFVPWAENASAGELLLGIVVLLHGLLQIDWIKSGHAVVDERQHGCAWPESEPCDESLPRLESSILSV